jgi:hypothetical protein
MVRRESLFECRVGAGRSARLVVVSAWDEEEARRLARERAGVDGRAPVALRRLDGRRAAVPRTWLATAAARSTRRVA